MWRILSHIAMCSHVALCLLFIPYGKSVVHLTYSVVHGIVLNFKTFFLFSSSVTVFGEAVEKERKDFFLDQLNQQLEQHKVGFWRY